MAEVYRGLEVGIVRLKCDRCNKGYYNLIKFPQNTTRHICSFCREEIECAIPYPRLEMKEPSPTFFEDEPLWWKYIEEN